MKQSCPYCKTIIEINEHDYTPGSTVVKQCSLCDQHVTFVIPKNETVEKDEYDQLKQEEDLLKNKIALLEQELEDEKNRNEQNETNSVGVNQWPLSETKVNEINEQAIREEIRKELRNEIQEKTRKEYEYKTKQLKNKNRNKTIPIVCISAICGIAIIALVLFLGKTKHRLDYADNQWDYYKRLYEKEQQTNREAQNENQELIYENQKLKDFKATVTKTYPIIITDIKIGNAYSGGVIETDYGEPLYNYNTMYLTPKIEYTGLRSESQDLNLYVKWYRPSGELSRGSSSPNGYSQSLMYSIYEGKNELVLIGWGGADRGHWSSGRYRIEIWYNNICLKAKTFTIH